ncbi:hypothetical protein [Streptomyces sp. G1]|uniref:hypothetical protein n=1 Tax=Streptomyces sp. G1 TaxID=361572 RepID=UPI00203013D1|nr:hypothetical protein [Streptomyces sp. G1]MCM1966356.1 hypothetical protein [Streptomyces sp. G1]
MVPATAETTRQAIARPNLTFTPFPFIGAHPVLEEKGAPARRRGESDAGRAGTDMDRATQGMAKQATFHMVESGPARGVSIMVGGFLTAELTASQPGTHFGHFTEGTMMIGVALSRFFRCLAFVESDGV